MQTGGSHPDCVADCVIALCADMWSHGLIPSPAYTRAKDACEWDHFLTNCTQDATHPSLQCRIAAASALRYVPSPLDPYDVLAPTCASGDGSADAVVMREQPFLRRLRETHGADSTPTCAQPRPSIEPCHGLAC